jgi:hypothetical protein
MSFILPLDEQRCIAAYLDSLQAKLNALPAHAFGRLQSASGEELSPKRRLHDLSHY